MTIHDDITRPIRRPHRARHGKRVGYWMAAETLHAIAAVTVAIVASGALSLATYLWS